MEGFQYKDIFATKGLEYILILGFLVVLVLYFRLLNKKPISKNANKVIGKKSRTLIKNFKVSANLFYHQSHSWLKIENSKSAWIGMDEFIIKLFGTIDRINLPEVGSNIHQGGIAFKCVVDGKSFDIISPVSGKIVEVNQVIKENPPNLDSNNFVYSWLLKIESEEMERCLNNLLSGKMAESWLEESLKILENEIPENLIDGFNEKEIKEKGIAKLIDQNNWENIIKKFLKPTMI